MKKRRKRGDPDGRHVVQSRAPLSLSLSAFPSLGVVISGNYKWAPLQLEKEEEGEGGGRGALKDRSLHSLFATRCVATSTDLTSLEMWRRGKTLSFVVQSFLKATVVVFHIILENQQHLICLILPIQSAQKLCQFQTPSLHPSSFIGDRFLLTATAHAARTKTKRNEEKPSHLEPLAPDRQRQTLRPPFFTPNFSEIPPLSFSLYLCSLLSSNARQRQTALRKLARGEESERVTNGRVNAPQCLER